MKKRFQKMVAMTLTGVMLVCTATPAFAQSMEIENEVAVQTAMENIAVIESELAKQNTSVVEALESGKQRLELMLSTTTDVEEKEKVEALINAYEKFITMQNQTYSKTTRASEYDSYIVAAIAFFDARGWYLSAELLTHMFEDQTGRDYRPINSDVLYDTSMYQTLRANAAGTYTSGAFSGGSSAAEKDAYYAIHNFDAYITSSTIAIEDEYNFIDDSDSAYKIPSIVGIAISVFRSAERAGVLTPYLVVINLDK